MERVLIVGAGNLFDEGLRRLLSEGQTSLDVMSVAYENDVGLLRVLLDWRPTAIVLFEGGPMTVSRVYELINNVAELMTVRVITALTKIHAVEPHETHLIAASN